MPITARNSHCHIVGVTGMGKSKFMEDLMVQDLQAGRAIGLIDPHADLARDTLANLIARGYFADEAAYQKMIYLDPARTDYTIPFNVLKFDLPPNDVAEIVIESMRRTWPKALAEAPRFSNIALVSLLVLIETGQTLAQLPKLLTDVGFRKHLLAQVRNADLVDYFNNRFNQWGRDVAVMIEPVLNKVTAYTLSPALKNMVGHVENRLDLKSIMDDGLTLIVNLGRCSGETEKLLGSLILTSLERMALTRGERPERRPYYLFLDEFEDYSASEGGIVTLAKILSDCRKFGLFLHLGHQTLGQLHERLVSALNNIGVEVVFGVGREDAQVMAPKLFGVNLGEIKHEAQTETQHPVYAPLPEQWERRIANLQNLLPRQAWVRVRGQPPVRITTEPIPPYQISEEQVKQVEERLARTHGVPAGTMEGSITRPMVPVPAVGSNWEG